MGKENGIYFDRNSLKFIGIDETQLQQLQDTYAGIDITQELNKMSLWLQSSKGLRRKGNIGFIMNWLNNATPSLPLTKEEPVDVSLEPIMQEYRKGLWQGKEHILEFNTVRKKKMSIFRAS